MADLDTATMVTDVILPITYSEYTRMNPTVSAPAIGTEQIAVIGHRYSEVMDVAVIGVEHEP